MHALSNRSVIVAIAASFARAAAASPIRPLARRLAAKVAQVWRELDMAGERIAFHRQLRELDDRMLKDLGISRAQAQFEASRPAWKTAARDRASDGG